MVMVKKIFILLLIATLSFVKAQENVADLISVPGPIELNGTEFFLSWSKQPSVHLSTSSALLVHTPLLLVAAPWEQTLQLFFAAVAAKRL